MNGEVEADLRFGQAYSMWVLFAEMVMVAAASMYASSWLNEASALGFALALASPFGLTLHFCLMLIAVYMSKRYSGHKRSLALPHHTKPIRGDPSKGPLLRRFVLRIKSFIFRISPIKTLLHGLLVLLASWLLIAAIIVCFGAPVLSHHYQTASLTTFILTRTALPIVLIYGPEADQFGALPYIVLSGWSYLRDQDPLGHLLYIHSFGTLLGVWLGAVPIPLDWDRPWQTWPCTCVLSAFLTTFTADLVSSFYFHTFSTRHRPAKNKVQ